MKLVISSAELEKACAHGGETYPRECCGLIVGRREGNTWTTERVHPTANVSEEERNDRYVIDPEERMRVDQESQKDGFGIVGFYHSHPDHPAYPSAYDLEHAFPFFSYVIVSVENAEPKAMRSFVLAEDRQKFLEETVEKE